MSSKVCTGCGIEKPVTQFSPRKDRLAGITSKCKLCLTTGKRCRYAKNTTGYRDQQKAWSKTSYARLKDLVLEAYGGKCVCCGETEPLFLTVDHIDGSGASARRAGEGLGGSLYCSLKRRGFPKDNYQLLCYNCNCAKKQFGTCPHQTARQLIAV